MQFGSTFHYFAPEILRLKFPNIQAGIWYIQFISIAYIVLMHISIFISCTETLKNIKEIIIHKLVHESANSICIDIRYL